MKKKSHHSNTTLFKYVSRSRWLQSHHALPLSPYYAPALPRMGVSSLKKKAAASATAPGWRSLSISQGSTRGSKLAGYQIYLHIHQAQQEHTLESFLQHSDPIFVLKKKDLNESLPSSWLRGPLGPSIPCGLDSLCGSRVFPLARNTRPFPPSVTQRKLPIRSIKV